MALDVPSPSDAMKNESTENSPPSSIPIESRKWNSHFSFARIASARPPIFQQALGTFHRLFLLGTVVVWKEHRAVFEASGYSYRRLREEALLVFSEWNRPCRVSATRILGLAAGVVQDVERSGPGTQSWASKRRWRTFRGLRRFRTLRGRPGARACFPASPRTPLRAPAVPSSAVPSFAARTL